MREKKANPPKLGDVEFRRDDSAGWKALRAGEEVASGLSFDQVLAIVRGETSLAEVANGSV